MYIASAVLGAIAAGIALLLFALAVFLMGLPLEYSGFFSALAFGIGCLVAGFAAGAFKRQGGLRSGILAALMFALPVVLFGGALGGLISVITSATFNKLVIAVGCGALGGVLGVNKDKGF